MTDCNDKKTFPILAAYLQKNETDTGLHETLHTEMKGQLTSFKETPSRFSCIFLKQILSFGQIMHHN
jgi:hypothetical protein